MTTRTPMDDLRSMAGELGKTLLRGVVKTGVRAVAAAYDTTLEDVEKALTGGAESLKRRRARVRNAAGRMDDK